MPAQNPQQMCPHTNDVSSETPPPFSACHCCASSPNLPQSLHWQTIVDTAAVVTGRHNRIHDERRLLRIRQQRRHRDVHAAQRGARQAAGLLQPRLRVSREHHGGRWALSDPAHCEPDCSIDCTIRIAAQSTVLCEVRSNVALADRTHDRTHCCGLPSAASCAACILCERITATCRG